MKKAVDGGSCGQLVERCRDCRRNELRSPALVLKPGIRSTALEVSEIKATGEGADLKERNEDGVEVGVCGGER